MTVNGVLTTLQDSMVVRILLLRQELLGNGKTRIQRDQFTYCDATPKTQLKFCCASISTILRPNK